MDCGSNGTDTELRGVVAFVQSRINADFNDTGLAPVELKHDPEFARPDAKASGLHMRAEDVIVTCGGHRFISHLEHGVEAACAHIASVLQDDVMDLLSRPWPYLSREKRSGFLEPVAEPGGIALWSLRGDPICAIGQLRELFDRYNLPWP